jgi:excisionase family DNA binding protein
MNNPIDEQAIRNLRLDYKIIWLEGIFKGFITEALTEFKEELRRLEELKSPLLTIGDVAKRFQVCKATVHNWIDRGVITGFKVGKNRYFTEEEVRNSLIRYGYKIKDDLPE